MTHASPQQMTERVKALALEAGFARVGVTTPDTREGGARLRVWLDAGRHGTMAWMARTASLRIDPTQHLPGCRAVVALSIPYDSPHPLSTEVPADPERAWLSRYAWGDDYHDVVRRMLRRLTRAIQQEFGQDPGQEPGQEPGGNVAILSHVDSGPVLERSLAVRAGLGWIGKNTCLIDPERGSFVFLAALLTDLPLVPDVAPVPDACGACDRCLRVCPTGALVAPYELDARRCISYLTIEHEGSIPDDLLPGLGRHVFGCDLCQDVCPWNRRARERGHQGLPAFAPREGLFHPRLDPLGALWRGEFRRLFAASPVRRRGLEGLRTNVAAVRRATAPGPGGGRPDGAALPSPSDPESDETS